MTFAKPRSGRLRQSAFFCVVLLAIAACGGERGTSRQASATNIHPPSDPLGPTGSAYWNRRAPTGCSRHQVVKLVHAFVAAYTDGDLGRLDRIFTPDPDFQWYFDQVRRGTKGTKVTARSKLLDYFRGRHEQEDRLELLELDVRSARGWHGGFDFEYRLDRTANDLDPGEFHGKGAADCTIFVWAYGAS